MTKIVHVVIADNGLDYSDHHWWIQSIHESGEEAQAMVELLIEQQNMLDRMWNLQAQLQKSHQQGLIPKSEWLELRKEYFQLKEALFGDESVGAFYSIEEHVLKP